MSICVKKVWVVDSNTRIGTGNKIPNWVGTFTSLDKKSGKKEKIQMIQEFRNEVQQFLTSEVGQATVRGPLALGVASGALLLSQMAHTSSAHDLHECIADSDCGSGRKCDWVCEQRYQGSCIHGHYKCKDS